ncbi:MAG: hypothetical protein Q7T07_13660 [Burkholderiaceae bacterium]|nr:hypothetical protein [Burkholderiaceae bacterium]
MATNNMKDTVELNASSRSAWRNPFGIALVVYYLVMAIVGMLVPDDILKSHAWAREFSDFMAGIVQQIDRVTALNIKPDVNRFYFSVLWAGSPVLVLLIVIGTFKQGLNTETIRPNDSVRKLLGIGLALTAMSLAILSMPFAESSPKLTNGLIGLFLGRGLLGQILFVNGPIILLVIAWINMPYFLLTGKYQKALEDKRNEFAKNSKYQAKED